MLYRIEEIKEKIEQKRGELTQNADMGGGYGEKDRSKDSKRWE